MKKHLNHTSPNSKDEPLNSIFEDCSEPENEPSPSPEDERLNSIRQSLEDVYKATVADSADRLFEGENYSTYQQILTRMMKEYVIKAQDDDSISKNEVRYALELNDRFQRFAMAIRQADITRVISEARFQL